MSSISITCPCCGVLRLKPRVPSIHDVPWGECGCSDRETCIAHKLEPSLATVPPRPTDAALAEKAERIYRWRLERFAEQAALFQAVEGLVVASKGKP